MTRIKIALVAVVAGIFALTGSSASAEAPGVEAHIRHLMHGMFDRPDARLTVDPIVASGDYALAGWTQAETGGRALLRRKNEAWVIILCAGDAIRTADALVKVGMPARVADDLAKALAQAESKISPERLAMFSRFDGIMMIDEGNSHPPHPQSHGRTHGH